MPIPKRAQRAARQQTASTQIDESEYPEGDAGSEGADIPWHDVSGRRPMAAHTVSRHRQGDERQDGEWLHPEASKITRRALVSIPPDELHVLLCLDDDDAATSRAHLVGKRRSIRERAEARDRIADLLSKVRDELAVDIATDRATWTAMLGMPVANVLASVERIERAARTAAGKARDQIESIDARMPRHDSNGARASVIRIRNRLYELRQRLPPPGWSVRQLVELVRASSADWIVPPCPALARLSEESLAKRFEQHLSRHRRSS